MGLQEVSLAFQCVAEWVSERFMSVLGGLREL